MSEGWTPRRMEPMAYLANLWGVIGQAVPDSSDQARGFAVSFGTKILRCLGKKAPSDVAVKVRGYANEFSSHAILYTRNGATDEHLSRIAAFGDALVTFSEGIASTEVRVALRDFGSTCQILRPTLTESIAAYGLAIKVAKATA